MKHFLITACLLLALSGTGLAQQAADAPASKEDVEKYFQVTHSREMLDKMIEAMSKPMQQMIHEQCEKDKDKLPPDCEGQMNKIIGDMWKRMPWDEMLQAMVPAYQKHFTKGDIDALVAFYGSPTGQKVLREMPAITGEAMQSMMPILRRQMDQMTQRIQQQAEEWAKSHEKEPGQAPPARN